ncbi:hypothetical protein DICVIV_10358 [Dictyocaulus viviparus]|uniref:Uncharacterized protein n=1 Tax=Dictyocaulus viviparus TaxID=29172 RepID=A0A0D8XMK3_DICVI|nr:hypothetical protein DICVIV_10358 [Dictyocaulus viviparus]
MIMMQENPYRRRFRRSLQSDSITDNDSIERIIKAEINNSGHENRHYTSVPTRWSFPNSSITDPIYICDDRVAEDFSPLPRADSSPDIPVDSRIEEHFIGVRTSDEAATQVRVDDFALYYKRENNDDISTPVTLFLVHRNTKNMFRHLSELVRCYHLYRFTDACSGRMEVFPLWKGGMVDDYNYCN